MGFRRDDLSESELNERLALVQRIHTRTGCGTRSLQAVDATKNRTHELSQAHKRSVPQTYMVTAIPSVLWSGKTEEQLLIIVVLTRLEIPNGFRLGFGNDLLIVITHSTSSKGFPSKS